MAKSSIVVLLVVLIFSEGLLLCSCKNSTFGCIETERQALLQLKQSFNDPSNRLVSWTGDDCCQWNEVGCNQITRHVVKLDLRAPLLFDLYSWRESWYSRVNEPVLYYHHSSSDQLSAVEVNSGLAELKHLEYLDLSGNDFQGSTIPKFFGSLKHLKYLNLSYSSFGGRIPVQLGNLTSLQILDLSHQLIYDWSPFLQLYADHFQWVSGLSSLKHLDMSFVNLSKALDAMQVLNTLPSLKDLRLNGCAIQSIHFPRGSLNSTFLASVQFLSLRYNRLSGPIPEAFQNMTALRELDLGYQWNFYFGEFYVDNLQWVSRLSSLQRLDMSGADLTKALDVMQVLNTLPYLVDLRLNYCGIQNIHFPPRSLNSTFLASVQFLSLSANSLTRPIKALQNMTALRALDLSYQGSYHSGGFYADNLQGVSRLSSLQRLDMSGANLTKALDVIQVLNTLPYLMDLHLKDCGIQNIHFSPSSLNSTFLASVQFLSLSKNSLTRPIKALQNMTALRALDLSYQRSCHSGGFYADNLPLVSRLSSLQHLDMSGVNLSKALDLMQVLSTLPSLLELLLHGCEIQNIHFSHGFINSTVFSRVQILDLSSNELKGPIPDALQNMTVVRALDLSYNHFNSTIPLSLVNSKSLVGLNLEGNEFENIEGGLLSILNKACTLRSLGLSENLFHGDVLGSNKNSSRCLVYDLEYLSSSNSGMSGYLPDYLGQLKGLKGLYLHGNSFYGPIPSWVGELSKLSSLVLSENQLNGTIPQSLGRLSTLEELDLSHNQLIGSIPQSLGQLVNLWKLRVSSNSLQGTVSELNFANLSNLRSLDIGSNNLSCKFKSDWIPPFSYLFYVNMSSCEIGSQFPRWIQTQNEVNVLDFSNTNISGSFPLQLLNNFVYYLDLSTNKISGDLPMNIADKMPFLRTLLLGNNLMNGKFPDSLCKCESLEVMDLSRNKLSGEIPRCWRASQMLYVINLSSNKLSGTIPNSIGHLSYLKRLHINKNNLRGELPLALRNCKALELLDLGENKFSGSIPTWIGESLSSLRILRLRNNMLHGSIPSQLCQLGELQILSLSNNNLRGRIPRCFGHLTGMMDKAPGPISNPDPTSIAQPPDGDTNWNREKVQEVTKGVDLEYTKMQLKLVDLMDLSSNELDGIIPEELCLLSGLRGLNLSHNHLSGNIPNKIGELKLLESLDLSNNHLSGSIPSSMSALPSISHLNLSHNNLTGKIPTSNQLQTLVDPSIYAGNLQLCGYPLQKCPGDDDLVQPPTSTNHEDEDHEDDKKEKILFYFVVLAGYATGLWGVIGTLVVKRNWRVAYFRFVDNTKEWMLAMVAVKVARMKKMMQRANTEE